MKYILQTVLLAIMICFSACGEDRSGEYYALIEDKMWIEETMQEHYLWYDQMPVIENENNYFKEANVFFKSLLSKKALNGKGDKYSYMEDNSTDEETRSRVLSLKRESTYGIEFELLTDPLGGTTHTYAHVLYTLPNSPAAAAGIKRGDWITSINGNKITSDNYNLLQTGSNLSITVDKIVETENGREWQAVETITLAASVPMEINPFLVDSVYDVNGQKVAYLVYNEFATGPSNESSETEYNEQMRQIFTTFKAQSPDAFVLDLRYNNGGYLQCAQALGSMLAPESALGKDFIKLVFNDKATTPVQHFPFDEGYASANLNLSKVYILTSSYTASASEALIYGLIPYMGQENVILLGEKTEGKNVAMTAYNSEEYGYTLWPVVAYVYNANDQGDYYEGITPQYQLKENDVTLPWYTLGDTREYMLAKTLELITTGNLSNGEESQSKATVIHSTLHERSCPGVRFQ